MSILNVLGLRLSGVEFLAEFMELAQESLRVNQEDPDCKYIEAWQDPADKLRFMLTSIWETQEALDEWYRSPFHTELRKRGMEGMLESMTDLAHHSGIP